MACLFSFSIRLSLLVVVLISCMVVEYSASDFNQDFDITWGNGRGEILNNGEILTLTLDNTSGSGFESKREYMFGKIDMQIKLVQGNSAGTVTAYYLSSQGSSHDEIDFEFLGNLSGEPYTVHTNVYTQGKGEREQQFHLWFDPTADFHTYSILWNPKTVVFSVDTVPIREFMNLEGIGVAFPKSQPMKLYSSLWNADEWATMGGLIKTDWAQAPFTASYRNFNANTCNDNDSSTCRFLGVAKLDPVSEENLRRVQERYMIYNYCTDTKRFPQGFPPECSVN